MNIKDIFVISLLLGLIALPCAAKITPGSYIQSPGEVVEELEKYLVTQREVYRQPEEDLQRSQQLLQNAFFATLICQVNQKDFSKKNRDTDKYLLNYQDYYYDTKRFDIFKSEHKNLSKEEVEQKYNEMLETERQRIIKDCSNCARYQEELNKYAYLLGTRINRIKYNNPELNKDGNMPPEKKIAEVKIPKKVY